MKKITLLAFFLIACLSNDFGQGLITCNSITNKIKFSDVKLINENVFSDKKTSFNKLMRRDIKKINGIIDIIAKNGKHVKFYDKRKNSDDPDQHVYEYMGLMPKINVYLIKEMEYEWTNYIVINPNDGVYIKLWGMPYVSPDGTKLLSSAANLVFQPMPNGVQIISVKQGVFKCLVEYTADGWEPSAAAWKDNTSIYIKKRVPYVLTNTKKDIISYAIMTFVSK
jgi:hypothetical protein